MLREPGTPTRSTIRGRFRRPAAGPIPPYEVWKFTRGRQRKFVFLDETRLGNYSLIWTNERREPSLPGWEDILGPEAVEDIRRF